MLINFLGQWVSGSSNTWYKDILPSNYRFLTFFAFPFKLQLIFSSCLQDFHFNFACTFFAVFAVSTFSIKAYSFDRSSSIFLLYCSILTAQLFFICLGFLHFCYLIGLSYTCFAYITVACFILILAAVVFFCKHACMLFAFCLTLFYTF